MARKGNIKNTKSQSKSIIEASASEARKLFLKHESYFSNALPPYFRFDAVLDAIKQKLGNEFKTTKEETTSLNEDIIPNCRVLLNKDGRLSWRMLQLIHPVLYVRMVNKLTSEDSWSKVIDLFKDSDNEKIIDCLSLPRVPLDNDSAKSHQIRKWWECVELKSLELSLEYEFMAKTDISVFYDSIYTHSIAWAIEGKQVIKSKRFDMSLLGNWVDKAVQGMNFGQTNGIPQGSVLMDFIAEILLVDIDKHVVKKMGESGVHGVKVLRYRDDYRIFSETQKDVEMTLRILSEVLSAYGLRLNSRKTSVHRDVVLESLKKDKIDWMLSKSEQYSGLKRLILINLHSKKYPQSGSLVRALQDFQKKWEEVREVEEPAVIGVLVDIAINNPRVYPECFSILSRILAAHPGGELDEKVRKIHSRMSRVPNSGYMEIWLQRISKNISPAIEFKEPLCQLISARSNDVIWNSKWISCRFLAESVRDTSVYKEDVWDELPCTIPLDEISAFSGYN